MGGILFLSFLFFASNQTKSKFLLRCVRPHDVGQRRKWWMYGPMLDFFAEASSFKKTDFQIASVLFPIEAERLGRRGSQEILFKLASQFLSLRLRI